MEIRPAIPGGAVDSSSASSVDRPLSPGVAPASPAPGRWRWLGRVPFSRTADLQERLRAAIHAGVAPETLLLLEHDPVITLGRHADFGHVLHTEASLRQKGVDVHRATRGGDVTYHGPGQLVGYPVIRVRAGVRAYVEGMARGLAEVLADLGIVARYRTDAPGLWVGPPGAEAKICAFGVNVSRRITTHGFALNLDTDLTAFDLIVPCGLPERSVTSVRALRGSSPAPSELAAQVAAALGSHLKVAFTRADDDADADDHGDSPFTRI